jgi:hypothetical protein
VVDAMVYMQTAIKLISTINIILPDLPCSHHHHHLCFLQLQEYCLKFNNISNFTKVSIVAVKNTSGVDFLYLEVVERHYSQLFD